MKTTIEIPDDLMREIKVKAAREDRKLKDVIPELLERGLASDLEQVREHPVRLPLLRGVRRDEVDEMTPERIAQILLEQEVEALSD